MLECAVRSDAGPLRANNEDAVFASPRLVAGALRTDNVSVAVADVLPRRDPAVAW